jgi:adenine-specific DNA-methyltransferase
VLSTLERARLRVSQSTDEAKKARLGQFLTPEPTAVYMASLFPDAPGQCRLLDAGAGIGSLSAAFLERWRRGGFGFERVDVEAFELDPSLHDALDETFSTYRGAHCAATILADDFVLTASDWLGGGFFAESRPAYTHAILNPPYRKIHSDSAYRQTLRRVGIETVNLYSAFVSLAVASSAPGGQIVAIIPRSFCNGPYYRPFRDLLFARTALHHIHLFGSRDRTFRDDNVLQENVIIRLERGGVQGAVTVSASTDDSFSDLTTHEYAFHTIVDPADRERFIHIPTSPDQAAPSGYRGLTASLTDLDVQVSTGPVVDFRLKQHLRALPEYGTVPLLYASHFSGGTLTWPLIGGKKPNAIAQSPATDQWLYPNGHYCVVRRFSSKEERHRVVASVVDPTTFGGTPALGFENHLHVFHRQRSGIPPVLAHGLSAYLNTTTVDTAVRRFNGHTQVNATDLRALQYPTLAALTALGEWAMSQQSPTQQMLDDQLAAVAA